MDALDLSADCQSSDVVPYDDGLFVGLHVTWRNCGPTAAAEYHRVVASPPDNSRTIVLGLQITGPQEADVVRNVFASFNFIAGATTSTNPGSSIPGPSVAVPTIPVPTIPVPTIPVPTVSGSTIPGPTVAGPTVPGPTVAGSTIPGPTVAGPTVPGPTVAGPTIPGPTVAGPTIPGPTVAGSTIAGSTPFVVPAGFVQLVDDTGTLTVAVPSTWTEIDTTPRTSDNAPHIAAATSLDSFYATYDSPGVDFVATPFNADQETMMSELNLGGGCQPGVLQPFSRGDLVGLHGIWRRCSGTTTTSEWHQIIASPADQSVTVVVQIQTTGPADQQALDTVISSFAILESNGPPTPTVAGPTIPGPATTLAAG